MRILKMGDSVFVEVLLNDVTRDNDKHIRFVYMDENELTQLKQVINDGKELRVYVTINMSNARHTEAAEQVVVDPGGTARICLSGTGPHI